MNGIVKIDSFLPPEWSKTYGDRVFQFDAFISHNWKDNSSHDLFVRLKRHGVNTWHDHHQNLNDQRVLEKITAALYRARMIVVCVGSDFQATPWCRAEYLNGLELERQTNAPRVIVAAMSKSDSVPKELQNVLRFICSDKGDFDRMVDFLRDQNRIPFTLNRKSRRKSLVNKRDQTHLLATCRRWLKQKNEQQGEETLAAQVLSNMVVALGKEFIAFNEGYFVARNVLELDLAKEKPWPFDQAETDLLANIALRFGDSPDDDNRANALMVLLCLAKHSGVPFVEARVWQFLAQENSSEVLALAKRWLVQKARSTDRDLWQVVCLTALRSPKAFNDATSSSLVSTLSDALRTRIRISDCINTQALSIREQIHLLSERASFILSANSPINLEGSIDLLRSVMAIADIEILFRDFYAILISDGGEPRDLAGQEEETYSVFLSICENAIAQGRDRKDAALLQMEDWIMDYVLIPLLLCSVKETHRQRAKDVYREITAFVSSRGCCADEVPGYLRALDAFTTFDSRIQVGRLFKFPERDLRKLNRAEL